MSKEIAGRLKRLRTFLKQNGTCAILITNPHNRRYLSGFDGTSGVLLIGQEQAILVTDFRYLEQAKTQASQFTVQRWREDLFSELAPVVKDAGWEKIAFESKHVVYHNYREMEQKIPAELKPYEDTVEKLRIIKSEAELAILRDGAKMLDSAFEHICDIIKPGMQEKELALETEMYLRRKGAEEPSFRFIVASGIRGAMPHGTASSKEMERGELVTIDFGGVFNGYATDMTRTVSLGEPGERCREIYSMVLKSQYAARESLKPGMKCSDADAVARDIFEQDGYGQYFGHGLGHGVGLETHEQPTLNPRSKTILEPGMVVTVEPGLYIPNFGGVRIEDMVCLTEEGAEIMTRSPRELITI